MLLLNFYHKLSLHSDVFFKIFFSSTGDGMNAYVAYKVSTRVCKLQNKSVFIYSSWIFTWLLKLPISQNPFYINYLRGLIAFISVLSLSPVSDVLAHV